MYIELSPTRIRRRVEQQGEQIFRSLSFDAVLSTRGHQGHSTLMDGRKLDSLPCSMLVHPTDAGTMSGQLTFLEAWAAEDLGIREPDSLYLDVCLFRSAFDELWQVVRGGGRIVLGGKVEGLPPKYPNGPELAPYEWDIGPKDSRTKSISEFWFAEDIRIFGVGRSSDSAV